MLPAVRLRWGGPSGDQAAPAAPGGPVSLSLGHTALPGLAKGAQPPQPRQGGRREGSGPFPLEPLSPWRLEPGSGHGPRHRPGPARPCPRCSGTGAQSCGRHLGLPAPAPSHGPELRSRDVQEEQSRGPSEPFFSASLLCYLLMPVLGTAPRLSCQPKHPSRPHLSLTHSAIQAPAKGQPSLGSLTAGTCPCLVPSNPALSLGFPRLSVREAPFSQAEAMGLPCPAVSVARGEQMFQIHFITG